jgi:hypothetical protein
MTRFLSWFATQRIAVGGKPGMVETVAAIRASPFVFCSCTSGLICGFMHATPVNVMYRDHGVDFQLNSPEREGPPDVTLEEMVERAAAMPLPAQRGRARNYSIVTDVLGYLGSVISGQEYLNVMMERTIRPLGMIASAFTVPAEKPAASRRIAAQARPG